jgi:hypothetical protein
MMRQKHLAVARSISGLSIWGGLDDARHEGLSAISGAEMADFVLGVDRRQRDSGD